MIYEENNGAYTLQIYEDDNPISPRQMDANIGRMISFHSRYQLGDRHDYSNKEEFLLDLLKTHFGSEEKAEEYFTAIDNNTRFIPPYASDKLRDDVILKELSEDHVILPVYLLDHSGLAVSTTSFGDTWDSGQIGWIYANKETVINEFGEWTPESIQNTIEFMEGEVRAFDDYLRGYNYMYDIIDNATGEVVDGGVWTGDLEDLKEDAREMMPEPMSQEEINNLSLLLSQKLRKEYDEFVDDVKKLTPQEIVDRAYQLTFKYDLMCAAADCEFSREEYADLLNAPNALETMYGEWMYLSNDIDEDLQYCCHKAAREAKIQNYKGGDAR